MVVMTLRRFRARLDQRPPTVVSLARLATFDQALAQNEANLDALLDTYRHGDPDSPEHIRIAGFSTALIEREDFDRVALAEHLTVALRRIDRLTHNGGDRA